MSEKLLRTLMASIGVLLLGSFVVARAASLPKDPPGALNMQLIGATDIATCDTSQPVGGNNCTPALSRAYSKNGDWPDTTYTFFNTGCYENGITPTMPGCFRVVDVSDPMNPKRIAEVPAYDPVNSPLPPPPSSSYWGTHGDIDVWHNAKFNGQDCTVLDGNVLGSCTKHFGLTISTACGDWKIDANGKYHAENVGAATCWDKGWITRTHYTAGADGDFKLPDYGVGTGHNEFIYWVNSQRQGGAPNTRPSYTGIAFYDLSDPHTPRFLSRIEATVQIYGNGSYSNAVDSGCSGGVHHGFFDGRYAFTGWCEAGFTGDTLTIIDAKDPAHPKLASRWWVPGQKNGETRDWRPVAGFTPVTKDTATGLLNKDVSMHYVAAYKIKGKDIAFCSWHSAGLIILDVTDRARPQFLSRFDYLTPDFQANDTTGPVEPTTGLTFAKLDHKVCQETWGNTSTWTNGNIDKTEAAAGRIACGFAHSGKIVPETNNTLFWITDEYFTVPYGHLRMFDVSDLKNPKLLSHFLLPPRASPTSTDSTTLKMSGSQIYSRNWAAISENFALAQDYPKRTASSHLGNAYGSNLLFMAWYGSGVTAMDISNPSNVKLVGSYPFVIQDGQGGAATYDVIFDKQGHLVVTDSNDGVRILEYTGPYSPLNTGPGSPISKYNGSAQGPKK
jgi:hypothetical protein